MGECFLIDIMEWYIRGMVKKRYYVFFSVVYFSSLINIKIIFLNMEILIWNGISDALGGGGGCYLMLDKWVKII